MNKEYVVSSELKSLSEKIISDKKLSIISESSADIEFLLVYPNINKTTVGRCMRVKGNMEFLTGLNYVIEMSGELWDNLNDKVKELVMYHELLHINPTYNEKKGIWTYGLRDHTVKDFYSILSKNGLEWYSELKTLASSVGDLSPEEEDNLKL